MIISIISIIFSIVLIYGVLIHKLLTGDSLKRPVLSIISMLLLFVTLHLFYFSNLGYPVKSSLPDKFKLQYFVKDEGNLYLMVDGLNGNPPRLHVLDYSANLEKVLNEAIAKQKQGKIMIGKVIHANENDYYGIIFNDLERNLPSK